MSSRQNLGYANESADSSKNGTLESSKGQSENGPRVTDFDTNESQNVKTSRSVAKEALTQKVQLKVRPKYPMKGS